MRDRRNFLKANIVFWLLGATDGHAKNFSVRLAPRGGFQLTQLYDVISLQPCLDSKAMRHRDFRLAMAIGKAREYRISEIHRRHFIETANTTTLGLRRAETLIDELIEATPRAIGQVRAALPAAFPEEIAASIFQGVEQRAGQLARERT